jgi:hypothetical protein
MSGREPKRESHRKVLIPKSVFGACIKIAVNSFSHHRTKKTGKKLSSKSANEPVRKPIGVFVLRDDDGGYFPAVFT